MDTQFIGEHLLPGQLGHFCIIISFVASLFSAFSYFKSVRTETTNPSNSRSWLLMGRSGFILHSASVVGIFGCLYYLITRHLFEYHYAWEHSSLSMPGKYLLACFWEGQEGSFMLWAFWHCVLGLIVMRTAKGLETRTMTIISLAQVFLSTMLLGIYLYQDYKVGSTPFTLLRQTMQQAPIFSQPNYMSFIHDGNGLNVLLQNYWMVIHPPVLFLGFSLTLIPFAYCIAALWKGEYESFVKPARVWATVGGAVLGTGIIMGGAWAYESLNFGGYWAWDPVENASLVPWLTLIAGLHTLILFKNTGRALPATMVLLLLTHLLVWYSTFLTRTGILGNTSVHAFTGDGKSLTYHLVIVMCLLLVLVKWLLIKRWKSLPRIKQEEETLTREFWMFVGSIVLLLSSLQIIITTSTPVWAPLVKWVSGKEIAPPANVMQHYNNIQVWIAVILGIFMGSILYMKYKHTDTKTVLKKLAIVGGIALAPAVFIAWGQNINQWQYDMMLYAACFGIVGSLYYAISVQKTKIFKMGPSIAHMGFSMVLLGILLSSFNKHVISINTTGFALDLGKTKPGEAQKENMENVVMFHGVPVVMNEYTATYVGDSEVPGKDRRIYYKVVFERRDSVTKKILEHFMLYPDAFINPKGQQGISSNPSTKHYWNRDIFTFINQATNRSLKDTSSYFAHIIEKPGDTLFVNNGYLVFDGFSREINDSRYIPETNDLAVKAKFRVFNMSGLVQEIAPVYILRENKYVDYLEDTVSNMDLYARLNNIIVKSKDSASVEMMIRQTNPMDDFIVLKTLVFPYINVLWLGVFVMVFGFLVSVFALLKSKQREIK